MSSVRAMQLWMGLMCTISTPTMVEVLGISLAHTCIQPPGAAHRSITVFAFLRNWYMKTKRLHNIALRKKTGPVLAIQLDEFVGRARSKALLLGEVVVLV
jgi:hypothetical protein